MNNVVSEVRAENPNFQPDNLSDHSLLLARFHTSHDAPEESETSGGMGEEPVNEEKSRSGSEKPKRFKIDGVKDDFLQSSGNVTKLLALIDELLEIRKQQDELDAWYSDYVKIYHDEMARFYRLLEDTPESKKNYFISRKAWWSDDLGLLAKETLLS